MNEGTKLLENVAVVFLFVIIIALILIGHVNNEEKSNSDINEKLKIWVDCREAAWSFCGMNSLGKLEEELSQKGQYGVLSEITDRVRNCSHFYSNECDDAFSFSEWEAYCLTRRDNCIKAWREAWVAAEEKYEK